MKFLIPIDLTKNEIQNAVVQNLAIAPTSPVKGQFYFDTVADRLFCYDGTVWVGADGKDAAIGDNSITNAKLAQMVQKTLKGNDTAGTANAKDLTVAEVKDMLTITNVENTSDANKSVASAAKLTTARKINGVNFDGTADISVTDASAASKLIEVNGFSLQQHVSFSGVSNTAGNVANKEITMMISRNVTLKNGQILVVRFEYTNTAASVLLAFPGATPLPVSNVASVPQFLAGHSYLFVYNAPNSTFDCLGSTKDSVGLANVDNTADIDKSVASAAKLTTARAINGVNFDGTAAITIYDSTKVPTTRTVNGHALSANISITKADVGLTNVTDNAQVKKLASSTSGNIPTWNGTTGDALSDGYGVETTLAGSSTKIPRADAVKNYVDSLLAASDAMVFRGTIGTGGTITALPTTYSAGWSYKVITAGTYAGHVCQIGDLIIATVDRAGSGNLNSDWTVVQTNIDGAVTGPASSTDGNFVLFDGVSGKVVKNSTYSPSSFSASSHNHDGVYTKKYSTTIGGSVSQVVTHNLNTREVIVMVRETGSPYAKVEPDIELTSVNTLTVKFAVAPSAAQYTITVIG